MATAEEKNVSGKGKEKGESSSMSLSKQPKYYEADGALRAYANRSFLLAVVCAVIALGSVAGYAILRIQPPTVIRVLPSGEATVVGADGRLKSSTSPTILRSVSAAEAPSAFEKEAYVRTFLENYLNYDEHSIGANWSHALNMTTGNIRTVTIAKLQKDDTVGKYEAEHVRSLFKLTSITPSQADPLLYTAYGVRTVHRMGTGQTEYVDEIVESYQVRLSESDRSALNPTGLLIAQVDENQIHTETKTVDSLGINNPPQGESE